MAYYYGSGQANPAMKYEMQDQHVAMPNQQMTVVRQRPKWSWCSTVTASFAIFLGCPLFGFIAILCSGFSYTDHKSGDYDGAGRKRRCSYGFGITGIILGCIGVIAIIVIYTVFAATLIRGYNRG